MDRPTGVTIVAVLNFVAAAGCLLVALGALKAGFVFLLASAGWGGEWGAGTFFLIGSAGLFAGTISLFLGRGIWNLRNRSRQIQIAVLALLLLFEFLAIFAAVKRFSVVSAVFRSAIFGTEAWMLIYLLTPGVREAFGAIPRRIRETSPYDD